AREGADVVGFDEPAVFVAEKILEENLEAERQRIRIPVGEFSERVEPEDCVGRAADVECGPTAERIRVGLCHRIFWSCPLIERGGGARSHCRGLRYDARQAELNVASSAGRCARPRSVRRLAGRIYGRHSRADAAAAVSRLDGESGAVM